MCLTTEDGSGHCGKWKGPAVTEGGFAYGKFFNGKAGFISRRWWPHFCNYRRHIHPAPSSGSVEETILVILQTNGSMITRELRAACGFTGSRMRSRFDAYVTRLQSATRLVTEDFVYPHDRHGQPYGWGWALLTTPEHLFGHSECQCTESPDESHAMMLEHLHSFLDCSDQQLSKLIG